jgi:hypothetical protein
MLSNPIYALKRLGRGVKNGGEIVSELTEEIFCNCLYVSSRDRIGKQKLKDFMIVKPGKTAFQKPFAQPPPVAFQAGFRGNGLIMGFRVQ